MMDAKPNPDNTLRNELLLGLEKIFADHGHGKCDMGCPSIDDDVSLLFSAIKNRLPKEFPIESGDYGWYNIALREVYEALDIESES